MKNIIILGSRGKVGSNLKEFLKDRNRLFLDEFMNIKDILNVTFLKRNKINCIINCIGSTNNENLFFSSNFYLPTCLSEKLKEIDLSLNQPINFIHISTIGIRAPYMKYNFKEIFNKPFQKDKVKYNLYEFSKACGEYNLKINLKNTENIYTSVIQPSNIIFKKSEFLNKLRFFLIIFPFRVDENIKLAITPIEYLLEDVYKIIETSKTSSIEIKSTYKRVKIKNLFKNYSYISFLKIKLPLNFTQKMIKLLPENFLFSRLKKILIFIFIL